MFKHWLWTVVLCGFIESGICQDLGVLPEQFTTIVGGSATFECGFSLMHDKNSIEYFQWLVNEKVYTPPYDTATSGSPCANGDRSIIPAIVDIPHMLSSVLAFGRIPAGCNNTVIQCQVLKKDGTVIQANKSRLVLQGRLAAPSNVRAGQTQQIHFFIASPEMRDLPILPIDGEHAANVIINWEAPFSLKVNGCYTECLLFYTASIVHPDGNITSYHSLSPEIHFPIREDVTHYHTYSINITANNAVGVGGTQPAILTLSPPCSSAQMNEHYTFSEPWQLELPDGFLAELVGLDIIPEHDAHSIQRFTDTDLVRNGTVVVFNGRKMFPDEAFTMALTFRYEGYSEGDELPDNIMTQCKFGLSVPVIKAVTTEFNPPSSTEDSSLSSTTTFDSEAENDIYQGVYIGTLVLAPVAVSALIVSLIITRFCNF